MPDVEASVLRVLENALGFGLRQGTGCPEVDERYRRAWPTCRGAPETRLPGLVEDDLKAHGRRVPWERVVRGSRKLVDQGGGRDLLRILLELKAAGGVECVSGERATYEDCDGKQVTGEVAWRLRRFGPHPMFSSADTEKAPFEWVGIVAASIDQWIQTPDVRNRFVEESERCESAPVLKDCALDVPESFALLAALHDKYCTDGQPIISLSNEADYTTTKRSLPHIANRSGIKKQLSAAPEVVRFKLRDALRQVVHALKLPVGQYRDAAGALGLPVEDIATGKCSAADGGIPWGTPQKGLWPARPFAPDCRETVPVDAAVIAAVKTLIRDWEGDNWSAVEQCMRLHGMPSDRILTMTPHDVRMWFAQARAVVRCATETATHTVYALPAPPPAPTEVAGCSNPTACGESTIPRRARKAGEQYQQAVDALGEPDPTDRQAYDQLVSAHKQSGEAAELPMFDTWQRNLREYRKRTGAQKNRPRAGREQGARGLIRADQLEDGQLPTRARMRRSDK